MTNSRYFAITSAVSLFLLVACTPSHAQDKHPGGNADKPGKQGKPGKPMMRTMKLDADKAVMIDEAGMIVTEKNGKLTVEFIPPKERRSKETAELDIVEGDEIGMADGKRMTSAKLLRKTYESIKPGDEVKLGLRRNGNSFIVVFTRKDTKDLPNRMIIRSDASEGADVDVLPALGIAIQGTDGELVITKTFPNAPEEMVQGDIIHSINGTTVKTLHDFSGIYDKVEIGATLKIGLLRKGKPVTVVTTRNKPQGKMIIK